ncbi:MAG: hypothetical protein QG608_103 [Actinomycetota bacterium]|nr:hypothetical protein [Actinomycetota bacterium]
MDLPFPVTARVRQIIGESGLAQGEFAVKAGLDPPKMSKSLNGTRRFTSLDLANIAELAGVTVDWLLNGDSVVPAMAARVADDYQGPAVAAAISHASALAQVRSDLRFIEGRSKKWVELEAGPCGRWIEQGQALAEQALELVRAAGKNSLGQGLADVIESVFGIDVAILDIDSGCDGLAWRSEYAKLIVVARSATPTRQWFTLAHELGHLLSGDDQRLHVDEHVMGPAQRGVETEVRANAFAASFLMPHDEVREASNEALKGGDQISVESFSRLVMRFAVSPSAMAFRLSNLGIISGSDRANLLSLRTRYCASLAQETETLAEWVAASQRPRPPMALFRDCLTAYFQGHITLRVAANVIGVETEILRDLLECTEQLQTPPQRKAALKDEGTGEESELVFAP